MKIKTLQYQCNDADINQVFANRFAIPCVTLCDTLCYVVPLCAFYQQSFTNKHNPLHFVSQGLFDWTKKLFSLSLSLYLSNVIILNKCCSLSFAHAHALSLFSCTCTQENKSIINYCWQLFARPPKPIIHAENRELCYAAA